MKRRIIFLLAIAMIMGSMAGCAGVIKNNAAKCAVSNCNNEVYKEGLCADHYLSLADKSKPENTPTPTPTPTLTLTPTPTLTSTVDFDLFPFDIMLYNPARGYYESVGTMEDGREDEDLLSIGGLSGIKEKAEKDNLDLLGTLYRPKDGDSLKGDVVIPDNIYGVKVGELRATFWGCKYITSVTIPDSVTKILDKVFNGCTGLTSITIPDSVTEIYGSAFRDCSDSLTFRVNRGSYAEGWLKEKGYSNIEYID